MRLLGALGLALAVLAGCVQDPVARKQSHLERGTRYLAERKHNEAIIELKNAIQIDQAYAPALRGRDQGGPGRTDGGAQLFGEAIQSV
jgi:Tfp pilus assembly protein PilF